jgi:hypothetical protein
MALTEGLISYWKLDESSGNAVDSVGGYTGTNTSVTYSSGKINNGASFNGSSSKFTTSTPNIGTTSWSCSCWINLNNLTNHSPILTNQTGIIFRIQQTTGVVLFWANGGAVGLVGSGNVGTGTWKHIVGTSSPGNGTKIYINGALDSSNANTTTVNTANMVMGFGTSTEYLNGMLDEVCFWNRELTLTEVTQLYAGGNGLTYPFLPTNIKFRPGSLGSLL